MKPLREVVAQGDILIGLPIEQSSLPFLIHFARTGQARIFILLKKNREVGEPTPCGVYSEVLNEGTRRTRNTSYAAGFLRR